MGTTGSGVHSVAPSRVAEPPVLARRPLAWVGSAIVVAAAQMFMWNGWNASGEWIDVTGKNALLSYALSGAACATPVVIALFVLRRWLGLAPLLFALLWFGVSTGRFFETSESSTAGIAWLAPIVYGPPVVFAVWLIERGFVKLAHR